MTHPRRVSVIEDEDNYRLVFEGDAEEAVTTEIEPDDRHITLSLAAKRDPDDPDKPMVDVSIKEVAFPKQLYSKTDVAKAANVLEEAIRKEQCAPCVILSTTERTKKTFIIPTVRDMLPNFEE